MSSVIVVDIGNTSTSVGVARGRRVTCVSHLKGGLKDEKAIRDIVSELGRSRTLEAAVLC